MNARELMRQALRACEEEWQKYGTETVFTQPSDAGNYFLLYLAGEKDEQFVVAFLDNRHRLIAVETLFRGTINGCSVHPRVVARRALELNAAAVIFAHNHPSGIPEPSAADRKLTTRLQKALDLFDIRTLDHIVVGAGRYVSMAERGLV